MVLHIGFLQNSAEIETMRRRELHQKTIGLLDGTIDNINLEDQQNDDQTDSKWWFAELRNMATITVILHSTLSITS